MSISCSMKTNLIHKETLYNNGSINFGSSPCYLAPIKQDFIGKPIHLSPHNVNNKISNLYVHAQATICESRSLQWRLILLKNLWIHCQMEMCQITESNSNAIFLKANYDRLNTVCRCLHIHVLPFFKFYRGEEGKLCSFSCTNSTIKKFKDALTKYGTDRCNIGLAKELDESEQLNLAAIGQISINLPLKQEEDKVKDLIF